MTIAPQWRGRVKPFPAGASARIRDQKVAVQATIIGARAVVVGVEAVVAAVDAGAVEKMGLIVRFRPASTTTRLPIGRAARKSMMPSTSLRPTQRDKKPSPVTPIRESQSVVCVPTPAITTPAGATCTKTAKRGRNRLGMVNRALKTLRAAEGVAADAADEGDPAADATGKWAIRPL